MKNGKPIDAKITFLGLGLSGKTSIILRTLRNEFVQTDSATIFASFYKKQVVFENHCVNLTIWDTECEKFSSRYLPTALPMVSRGSAVILLVFSLTDRDSFECLSDLVNRLMSYLGEMPILFVVGNKNDLVEERKVESEQAELYAKEIGAFYYEVSAKTGFGIEELFNRVAEESYNKLIHENNEQPSINLSNNDSHNNSKCT